MELLVAVLAVVVALQLFLVVLLVAVVEYSPVLVVVGDQELARMEALAVAQETMVVMVLMAVATALALMVLAAEAAAGAHKVVLVISDQQVRVPVQEQAAQAVRLYQELQER
jgi:hypothetical protein